MKVYTGIVFTMLVFMSHPEDEWLDITWALIGGGLVLLNFALAGTWVFYRIGGNHATHKL